MNMPILAASVAWALAASADVLAGAGQRPAYSCERSRAQRAIHLLNDAS